MRAMAAAGRFPAPGNLKPGSAPHPDREPGSVRDLPAGLSPAGTGEPGFAPTWTRASPRARHRRRASSVPESGAGLRPGRGRAGGLVRDAVGSRARPVPNPGFVRDAVPGPGLARDLAAPLLP